MVEPCVRCGQKIEADFLEAGRCIGCRRDYQRVKEYARNTLLDRSQMAARLQRVRAGEAKRASGKFK